MITKNLAATGFRRSLLATVAAVGSIACGVAHAAPPCPSLAGETITWIVPFGPGGGYDVYSRLIEPHLEAALGAEIAVTNVEGAGGVIGTKRISEAAGDGRTLGLVNAGGLMGSSLVERRGHPRARARSHDPGHAHLRRPRLAGPVRWPDRLGRGAVPPCRGAPDRGAGVRCGRRRLHQQCGRRSPARDRARVRLGLFRLQRDDSGASARRGRRRRLRAEPGPGQHRGWRASRPAPSDPHRRLGRTAGPPISRRSPGRTAWRPAEPPPRGATSRWRAARRWRWASWPGSGG